MMRISTTLALLFAVAAMTGWGATQSRAAEECCPTGAATAGPSGAVQTVADQELPAGHPPIQGGAQQSAAPLPQGHPPVGGQSTGEALPQGHPPIGGGMGGGMGGQMPAGHPPMGGMDPDAPAVGDIAIKAVQRTEGGPIIGAVPVTVALYKGGKIVDTHKANLDEKGVVILEGIKFTGVVQPVISLEHDGVTFQAIGKPMAATSAQQMITVDVYETTHEKPDWSVKMRHILVRQTPTGLYVSEMVVVENPDNRAWVGAKVESKAEPAKAANPAHGGAVTLALPIPAEATKFQAGPGFDACCTTVTDGMIEHRKALMPGTTQFGYSYELPAGADGRIDLNVATPAPIGHLMVFVPDDGMSVAVEGLAQGQSLQGKAMAVRVYQAEQVKPGDAVSLRIGRVTAAAPQGDVMVSPPSEPVRQAGVPTTKLIAGIGGGAILAAAVGLMLFSRSPKKDA